MKHFIFLVVLLLPFGCVRPKYQPQISQAEIDIYLRSEKGREELEEIAALEKVKQHPNFDTILLAETLLKGMDDAKQQIDPDGSILAKEKKRIVEEKKQYTDAIQKLRYEHEQMLQTQSR